MSTTLHAAAAASVDSTGEAAHNGSTAGRGGRAWGDDGNESAEDVLDTDEYGALLHDEQEQPTRAKTRSRTGPPVSLAALLLAATFLLLIAAAAFGLSGVDQLVSSLPSMPSTLDSRVDEWRQMFDWRADTPLGYQSPPPSVVLSDRPPALLALQACQVAYRTTRALLVMLSGANDQVHLEPLTAHILAVYGESKHGFCVLAVSTSLTSPTPSPPASSPPLNVVTVLSASQLLTLPYQYVHVAAVDSSSPLSVSFAKTVGALLLVHAGFDLIVDIHSPLAAINSTGRAKQLTTVDYTASTYTIAADTASHNQRLQHHCSATVQLAATEYTASTAPTRAAEAIIADHDQLTDPSPSFVETTAVFSPAFAGLYLPSSATATDRAYLVRSLVYLTFLSFLWVPTRPSAFLTYHDLEASATRPDERGPAPAVLEQSHCSACMVRWVQSQQQHKHPQTSEVLPEADSADEQAGDDSGVKLRRTGELLDELLLGHSSDAQQLLRRQLLSGNAAQGNAMRQSQEPDQLLQQIYTHISQDGTGLITPQDVRELRAFHADLRNIALTQQQARNRQDIATTNPPNPANHSIAPASPNGPLSPHHNIPPAVAVPRQSRTAVCIQFNYPAEDHSLHVLLTYHARLHRHLILSMPIQASELSAAQRSLLSHFPDITFLYCASYRGFFQYRCLHQCLVHSRASHVDSSGMLFLADDAWFNFTQSLVAWDKWLVDEFWYHSKAYLMDMSQPFSAYHGGFEPQWFAAGRDYHIRLQRSYYSWPQRYRDALNSVYGRNMVATEALSDVLYVPRADSQMDNLIEVLAEQMGQSDIWCEVMTAVLVDLAMILSGHPPNLPIFPAMSQQIAIFLGVKGYKDKDGVVRYIEGVQLDSDHATATHRFYQYMRRGSSTIAHALQNDTGTMQLDDISRAEGSPAGQRFHARPSDFGQWWVDEMEQMRLQHRAAEFYDQPHSIASCAIHFSDDGLIPASALRPVLLRPDGNVVLPQRKDLSLLQLLVNDEGTGWVHPIKMSDKHDAVTRLGVESLNRMVVQMSALLWEDEWWRRRTECTGVT